MKWLPVRVYENGVYDFFANPVGWDCDTVKPGFAMILDPNGDVVVTHLLLEMLENTPGFRYRRARRPSLRAKLIESQQRVTSPGWKLKTS